MGLKELRIVAGLTQCDVDNAGLRHIKAKVAQFNDVLSGKKAVGVQPMADENEGAKGMQDD
jgi:hypothetical protein